MQKNRPRGLTIRMKKGKGNFNVTIFLVHDIITDSFLFILDFSNCSNVASFLIWLNCITHLAKQLSSLTRMWQP